MFWLNEVSKVSFMSETFISRGRVDHIVMKDYLHHVHLAEDSPQCKSQNVYHQSTNAVGVMSGRCTFGEWIRI